MFAFHVDELSRAEAATLALKLQAMVPGDGKRGMLFCSPQALQLPVWSDTVQALVRNRVLKFVSIDEADKVGYAKCVCVCARVCACPCVCVCVMYTVVLKFNYINVCASSSYSMN